MSLSLDEPIPRGGWTLDPPAPAVLDRLWTALGTEVDDFYRTLYRTFGGQAAPDAQMAMLWPLERIVDERDCATVIDGRRYFAIGDVLIESDLLMVCLADAAAPAVLLHAGNEVAPSAKGLVEDVFAGRFPFGGARDAGLGFGSTALATDAGAAYKEPRSRPSAQESRRD